MGLPNAVLRPFAFAAGFRGQALTTICAIGNSEGGQFFVCNPDGPPACVSCGPWQIFFGASGKCEMKRTVGKKTFTRAYAATPIGSARAAWEISGHGTSFEPWTTYTNGDYLNHMPGHKGFNQGTPPNAANQVDATTLAAQTGGGGCSGFWRFTAPILCNGPFATLKAGEKFLTLLPVYLKMAAGGTLMLAGLAVLIAGATGGTNRLAKLALATAGQPMAAAAIPAEPGKAERTAYEREAGKQRALREESERMGSESRRRYTQDEAEDLADRGPRATVRA